LCSRCLDHLAIILVGDVMGSRVRGGADGSAALDIPVITIDDDLGAVTDQEEVPVNDCDEDTATDNVAKAGWNHALPDIVFHIYLRMVVKK